MANYIKDAETGLVTEQYAVIYAPRRARERFPETCVQPCETAEAAIAAADPEAGRHAAKVLGPCRSSEGLRLYYLVHWLHD